MHTLLTDFSYKELQYLYILLEDKAKELQDKIESVESVFSPGSVRHDLVEHLNTEKEINGQWMTKVYEATMIVKVRDIVNSN